MIFGTFCAVMTVHVFLFFPETAGKLLEEIDELFNANLPAWRSKDAVPNFEYGVAKTRKISNEIQTEVKQQVKTRWIPDIYFEISSMRWRLE
jgi:hypothetical protein